MVRSEDLIRQTLETYYLSNLLPTSLGGDRSTRIFKFLMSFEMLDNLLLKQAEVTRGWADEVSWATQYLHRLFKIPRFAGESDRVYYDRLIDLIDAKQDKDSIRIAIKSVFQDAIEDLDVATDIVFKEASSQGNWGDDLDSSSWDYFWNDGETWGDSEVFLRSTIRIDIYLNNSGVSSDPDNFEYWIQSENYTKVADIVKLYKPPGIDFELNLISPLKSDYSIISPSDGATGVSTSPTLDWDDVGGATKYEVVLNDNNNMVTLVEQDDTLTDSEFSVSGLSSSTTYYWRFRPMVNGEWHTFSDWSEFETA